MNLRRNAGKLTRAKLGRKVKKNRDVLPVIAAPDPPPVVEITTKSSIEKAKKNRSAPDLVVKFEPWVPPIGEYVEHKEVVDNRRTLRIRHNEDGE